MKKLRIMIADDHELVRRGARGVLHSQPGWRVVGQAANGRVAVEKTIKLKPDVAILDISMPRTGWSRGCTSNSTGSSGYQSSCAHDAESDQMVQRALDAGAHGYILKSDLTDSLLKGVSAVVGGKRFLAPKISEIVLDGFLNTRNQFQRESRADARTTPRELEIIRLLAQGKSNKQIAAQLGIAVRTVETHRANFMLKLGLHSLAELIHYAMREGIIAAPNAGYQP